MTPYPAWQTAIRDAQAVENARLAGQQAQLEARQAAERAQQAVNLAFVLNLFGIQAQPAENEWVVDGYRFRLAGNGARLYDPHFRRDADGYVWFTLAVNRHVPDEAENEAWHDWHSATDLIEVECKALAGDWTPQRALLAGYLDQLDSMWATFQEARAKQAQRQTPAPVKPAPGDELITLIERIVDRRLALHALDF